MAESLKAVIQLDADPSGVVRGVAGAQRELAKLNQSAASTAFSTNLLGMFQLAQQGLGYAGQVIDNINQRLDTFAAAANMFSPDAINANVNAQLASIDWQQRVGTVLGPYQGAVENMRAERTRADADRITAAPETYGRALIDREVNRGLMEAGTNQLSADAMSFAALNPMALATFAPGASYLKGIAEESVQGWASGSVGTEANLLLRQILDALGGR